MNAFKVAVTATLATLATIALLSVAAWSLWPKTAEASARVAAHTAGWSHADEDRCARMTPDHVDLGEAVVIAALDLTETQKTALAPITEAAHRWHEIARQTCEAADMKTLDGGLATLESALNQGSQAVTELRPLINDFYATLDVDQQEKMMGYLERHHRQRGGRRFGR